MNVRLDIPDALVEAIAEHGSRTLIRLEALDRYLDEGVQ